MTVSLFAEIAFYLWLFSEIFILVKTKKQRKNLESESKDKGSFPTIVVGIFVCIFLNQFSIIYLLDM